MKLIGIVKKSFLSILLVVLSGIAFGQEKIAFTPHWVAQAQFAGYYVAQEKGFYKEAGLDVTILPSSSTQENGDMLKQKKADIATMSLFQAIQMNDKSIINIMQSSQNSSLVIVTQPEIKSIKELDGKAVGVWKNGYGKCIEYALEDLGINVKWVYFLTGINYFTAKAISASGAMYYNEYLRLCNSGKKITKANEFFLSKMGYDFPEEGLYCRKADYDADPGKYKAFAQATAKGWEYAKNNKEEALGIVYEYMDSSHIQINKTTQSWMLDKVLEAQVDSATGKASFTLSEDSYNQLVDSMKRHGTIESYVSYNDFVNKHSDENGKE